MENVNSSRRKKSRADLASVKRKLDTEGDHSTEEESSKRPKKSERRLLQKTVKTLSPGGEGYDPVDPSLGSVDPTISTEAPRDESSLAVVASDGASGPNPSGAVQVTTVAHIPSIQHPVELRKVEQLV